MDVQHNIMLCRCPGRFLYDYKIFESIFYSFHLRTYTYHVYKIIVSIYAHGQCTVTDVAHILMPFDVQLLSHENIFVFLKTFKILYCLYFVKLHQNPLKTYFEFRVMLFLFVHYFNFSNDKIDFKKTVYAYSNI